MAEKNTKSTEKKLLLPKELTPAENEHNPTSSADDKTNHCAADNVTQATNSKKRKRKNAQWIMPINPLKLTTAFQRKKQLKKRGKNPENNSPSACRREKAAPALALLAILIALGVGGAGWYFGQQQIVQMQQKMTALEQQVSEKAPNTPLDLPDFSQ